MIAGRKLGKTRRQNWAKRGDRENAGQTGRSVISYAYEKCGPTEPSPVPPAQLLPVLHYPLNMPSSYPPFARYAKDGAPALVTICRYHRLSPGTCDLLSRLCIRYIEGGRGLKPAKCWSPAWRTVAHVVLVLSLVFNIGININLDQPNGGAQHMAQTMRKSTLSKKYNARSKEHRNVAKPTATTNCMGACVRPLA